LTLCEIEEDKMQAALKSFIPYDENHPFPLENIPFGCYQRSSD